MNPTLSVIVPTLDGRIPQSLQDQIAGRADAELVVVTGVSPVGRARNEGLGRATGDYLAWVDSDDEVTDDWFAEILNAISEKPDAVVFDLNTDAWPLCDDLKLGWAPGAHDVADAVRSVYENRNFQGHLYRLVTRRTLWDGSRFNEELGSMEDFLILPEVVRRARTIVYRPKRIYAYKRNEGSLVASVSIRRMQDNVRAALLRFERAPADFRDAARRGSVKMVYDALLTLACNRFYRELALPAEIARAARRFLRDEGGTAARGLHERLRYLFAEWGFWWPQRFLHWYHFTRKGLP